MRYYKEKGLLTKTWKTPTSRLEKEKEIEKGRRTGALTYHENQSRSGFQEKRNNEWQEILEINESENLKGITKLGKEQH